MISHRVPIEEFDELYAAFDARVGGVEKVFVQTWFRWVSSGLFPGSDPSGGNVANARRYIQ